MVEVNPSIYKHPRYSALTYQDKYHIRGYVISDDINIGQQYKTQLNQLSGRCQVIFHFRGLV